MLEQPKTFATDCCPLYYPWLSEVILNSILSSALLCQHSECFPIIAVCPMLPCPRCLPRHSDVTPDGAWTSPSQTSETTPPHMTTSHASMTSGSPSSLGVNSLTQTRRTLREQRAVTTDGGSRGEGCEGDREDQAEPDLL